MNLDEVEKIVNAVLYEGYVLYPYRPSSVKNRQRWTFGGLYPEAYSRAGGGLEPCSMQTECLVLGRSDTTLEVRVRFLHILAREVRELVAPSAEIPGNLEEATRPVESLWVGARGMESEAGQLYQTWQEATERDAGGARLMLGDLLAEPHTLDFNFPARREIEPLREPGGELAGVIVREQLEVSGSVSVRATRLEEGLYKVAVVITNLTPWEAGSAGTRHSDNRGMRDEALLRAFASTHTILSATNGEFISLFDPPDEYREEVASCENVGTWPVLVGQEGEHGMLLSSPIILYDYPEIAPESHGDLFDGTEIDEILTLRIMTLTDEEKQEMRAVDERARALLDRTESLTGEQMMNLHGTMRTMMARRQALDPEVSNNG